MISKHTINRENKPLLTYFNIFRKHKYFILLVFQLMFEISPPNTFFFFSFFLFLINQRTPAKDNIKRTLNLPIRKNGIHNTLDKIISRN